MRLGEHEGVVVYDPSNMFYLSGYTGEGLVLVARGISAIITDFRYTEQAQAQAPGFEVLMTEKGKSHEDIAGALCASGGIDTLYYEDDFVTVHTFNALRKSVRGVEWKVVGSEIARLREIKDEYELALIRQTKVGAAVSGKPEAAMGGKVVLDSQTGRLYLQIPGEGKVEMPLIAEGLRKIAMLARLVSTGVLLRQGFLFWDERCPHIFQ